MTGSITLVAPGCLGTCWHGKYHYLEPYCGCAHDCVYCYAKSRAGVLAKLAELGTAFAEPAPMLPQPQLLAAIKKEAESGALKTVKLSRFTDVFSPPFSDNGLALRILRTLADSPVERVIITTKGAPPDETIRLMGSRREKFSFNVVAKPDCGFRFEKNVPPLEARLAAAARVNAAGVKTTIHLDPLVPGFEDRPETLEPLLARLKAHGLNRVMFSYLLLNNAILSEMRAAFGADFARQLSALYDNAEIRMLPNQDDTVYASMKPALKSESVRRVSALLNGQGFEFVLCSLKSGRHAADCGSNLCDGSFYA
ncbi:MAG: radical SAM protein [Elusimicrobiaceae bacterium]|nr:radical SAM protein [Elusimicrobiaceae bacterium]